MSLGETYLTVLGWVGGDIKFKEVSDRVAVASFRLGATPRQYDKPTGGWVDRPTTWFTVECWRSLAQNVHDSVVRGHPVVVTGRLKTTEWVDNGEKRHKTVIEAFSVGHDLSRGTASFTKNLRRTQPTDSLNEEMRDVSGEAEPETSTEEESPFTPEEVATPDHQAA